MVPKGTTTPGYLKTGDSCASKDSEHPIREDPKRDHSEEETAIRFQGRAADLQRPKQVPRSWKQVLSHWPDWSLGPCWSDTCKAPCLPRSAVWGSDARSSDHRRRRERAGCEWWRGCEWPGSPWCPPSPSPPWGETFWLSRLSKNPAAELGLAKPYLPCTRPGGAPCRWTWRLCPALPWCLRRGRWRRGRSPELEKKKRVCEGRQKREKISCFYSPLRLKKGEILYIKRVWRKPFSQFVALELLIRSKLVFNNWLAFT